MNFDTYQSSVIHAEESRILVAAGSGSGKTAVITERIKVLLQRGYLPETIFVITYTNNAAEEVKQRINNKNIFVGTMHGLANRILLKNGIDTRQDIENEDFNNLFFKIKQLKVQVPIISHLLVDEFQDVHDSEYYFIQEILKPQNFFFVGDSRQNIFGFNGGNGQHFLDLAADDTVTVYELINNYRSGVNIVNFATGFLRGMSSIYDTPVRCQAEYEGEVETEIFNVPSIIGSIQSSFAYNEWAILCRTNKEIDNILFLLKRNNIPAISFKKSEYSAAELKELLSQQAVKVLTIHSAKGLEFDRVMVVGARSFNDEEKRLCYVAATRAKHYLLWFKPSRAAKKQKQTSAFF